MFCLFRKEILFVYVLKFSCRREEHEVLRLNKICAFFGSEYDECFSFLSKMFYILHFIF